MSSTNREQLTQCLRADAAALDVALDATQLEKLVEYLFQLERWNKTYNLTAIRHIEAMRIQHVVDSLAVLPALNRIVPRSGSEAATGATETHVRAKIMDVGSGGGLPGVVVAIARPDWMVTCVDAVEKKTAFIRHMSGVLDLPNLDAAHARVERLARADCDVVISRAFASLADFARLSGKHVNEGGTLAAMKGKQPHDEIEALHGEGQWRVTHIDELQVPGLDAERCVVFMRRV